MTHRRNTKSLVVMIDPDAPDYGRIETVVKRDRARAFVKNARAEGFKVIMVIHDYHEDETCPCRDCEGVSNEWPNR